MNALLTLLLSVVFFPITILGSFVVVHPLEEVVLLRWGVLEQVIRAPGIYWVNCWGRGIHRVSMAQQTIELPKNTVADGNGNPIVVAGIVTFAFADSRKVSLEVQNAHEFVRSQSQAVLKQIASNYPYESKDGPSLKTEAGLIGAELVQSLQTKVAPAGARVISFELSDLTYAPEIAPSMLIRQQAQALIEARKTIVEGAVAIVKDAVDLLEKKNLPITGEARSRLVTNLLTVICGEAKVQPTVSVASDDAGHAEVEALLRGISGQLGTLVSKATTS